MKILLFGHNGWIGSQFISILDDSNIAYIRGKSRANNVKKVEEEILLHTPSHIISFIGRTHGEYNGVKINTIDYLEEEGKLQENLNDNLFGPMVLGLLCEKYSIHYTYIGTGCIFEYDENHPYGLEKDGFTEDSEPNFFGSSYSVVKGYTDRLVKLLPNCLNLRIRMPITNQDHPRNFISKILRYDKICSIPNSMTVLPLLMPVLIKMMLDKKTGTYNFVNPGLISHNEILEMYKAKIDPTFSWNNFDIKEQNIVLRSKRSNNYLETTKLTTSYDVPTILDAVEWCFDNWTE